MAAISTGGGKGNKKSVDQEIPLIPFIDLLLCCVMFLLVTAVWNQLAAMEAKQQIPGQVTSEDSPPEDEKVKLILQVRNTGYVLASSAGESVEIRKKVAGSNREYDVAELNTKLGEWKLAWDKRNDLIVAPEDGVSYEEVIRAMDAATAAGFPMLSVADAATMM